MKLALVSIREELPGVETFVFEPPEGLDWLPGQYMFYKLPHPNPDDRGIERYFTVSSASYEKHIQITTRFDGDKISSFKQALRNLKPGDTVEASGPKGRFITLPGERKHIFIAGGIGITPYRSILAQLANSEKPINVELLYANRGDNFVFSDELDSIAAKNPNFKIHKFSDKHIESEDLKPYLENPKNVFYLSGPRSMVESYEATLPQLGVDKDLVITDYFPGY